MDRSPIFTSLDEPEVIYDRCIGIWDDSPIILAAKGPEGNIWHLSLSAIFLAIFSRGMGTLPNRESLGLT